jgi:hypothetical protein
MVENLHHRHVEATTIIIIIEAIETETIETVVTTKTGTSLVNVRIVLNHRCLVGEEEEEDPVVVDVQPVQNPVSRIHRRSTQKTLCYVNIYGRRLTRVKQMKTMKNIANRIR